MKFKIGVLIFFVLFALSSVAAFANTVPPYTNANTYWVDGTNGLDTQSGLTVALAKKTISSAITAAKAVSPTGAAQSWGHIIIVKPGTYAESIDLSVYDADLDYLTIMGASPNPDSVVVTSAGTTNGSITICQNGVKITGIKFQALSGQVNSLVEVPGTGSKGVNFYFYNCVFDQNTVTTTTMTKGLVDLTLAADVAHTTALPNFENCKFLLTTGTTRGITLAAGGAFTHTNLYIKGCSFVGKGPLTADLTSKAIYIDPSADFVDLWISGNHFKYTNVEVQMTNALTAADNEMDGLHILGNFFDLGDGVLIKADAPLANDQFTTKGISITGNHFRLNDVTAAAASRRAGSYALNLDTIGDSDINSSVLWFNYNNIEVKQPTGGDASGHVRTTARTTNFVAAVINNNYWWGTGAPAALATVDAGPAITLTEFTAPGTNWTPASGNIPALVTSSGIEVFDMDENGHIDKAIVYMSKRINPGSVPSYEAANKDGLNVGSGYTIARTAIETGVTNACTSIAVYFTESYAFDTSVKPQVTYTSASDAGTRLGGLSVSANVATEQSATWTELEAAEVDKAKPVLVKAETLDTGKGTGVSGNGMLDAIQFTFSEEVFNIRAFSGTALAATGATADSNLVITAGDISFNQGSRNLTAGTSVYTLAVGEIRLNTGLTPTVKYQRGNDVAIDDKIDVITDHAVSATGANAYNLLSTANMVADDLMTINVLDNAALVAASVKTADADNDGKIDQIAVTFSEPVATTFTDATNVKFFSTVPNFGSGSGPTTGYYTFGITVSTASPNTVINGSVITFTLDENSVTSPAEIFDTESIPEFRYTTSTTATKKITDTAGVQLATYGSNVSGAKTIITTDGAAPVMVKITTQDAYTDTNRTGGLDLVSTDPNGRLDGVRIMFSEKIKTVNGAEASGATTARDNALAQFTLKHINLGNVDRVLIGTDKTYGKPVWTDSDLSGDSATEVIVSFKEADHAASGMVNGGDTGSGITTSYSASGTTANNVKDYADNLLNTNIIPTSTDGAAPFVVQGIGKGWGTSGFSNISTVDSAGEILGNTGDTANGNGFIDGFLIKFTETVTSTALSAGAVTDSLGCFTTTLSKGGTLLFTKNSGATNSGKVDALTGSSITLTGIASQTAGEWNTEITPDLVFTWASAAGKGSIKDGATPANYMKSWTRSTSDGAKPVITNLLQNGSVKTQLEVSFSEPVYGRYASTTINANIDSLNIPSNQLFGYEDTSTGGATALAATYIKRSTDSKWIVTLNAELTENDISTSRFWIKDTGVFDNANVNEASLTDNEAVYYLAGTNIKVKILDDVVKPFITGITTVDADGNGYIDHLRIQLSEAIKDTTIGGYVRQNTMSTDVATRYIISGYTGTVKFNFFNGSGAAAVTDAGKDAAAVAVEPVFNDNGLNDAVLYIKIEEDKLTKYTGTQLGNTNYTGTISFGSGANVPTLTDMSARANILDTTFGTVATAEKGKITDDVGPVLMKAEWANSKVNLYFSEDIADTAKAYKCVDFNIYDTYAYGFDFTAASDLAAAGWGIKSAVTGFVTTTNFRSQISNILWLHKGRVELTMVSGFAWPADKALGIQLSPSGTLAASAGVAGADNTTECIFKDAAVNAAGSANVQTSIKYDEDPDATATWYTVGNKGCPFPYITVPRYDHLSLVLITGVPSVKLTAPASASNVMVGQSVDVKWSSTNVDSVDVWVSKNLGLSFTKVAGARTVATAGLYKWTVSTGANYVQVSSAADSAICSKSGLFTIISGGDAPVVTAVGAPSNLVLTDVPNDNGHWMFATFTKSVDHLTRVKSYQFYREVTFALTDTTSEKRWVYSAVVPAGVVDVNNKMTCLVPSIINGVAKWAVVASTGDVVTDLSVAAKEADMPVAMLVDAAEKAAAEVMLSALSATAEGGAIDNIAPGAIVTFAADDNEGVGTGVKLTWTAPEDHGLVGYYGWAGVGSFPIYGVDEYQVWRKEKGAESFVLVGAAAPLSTSYIDAVKDGATIYQYMVKAVDSAHAVETSTKNALAFSGGSDFTSDGVVDLGDLILFGNQWGSKSTDANWISAFDLKVDGTVDLSDLILLGNAWTVSGKMAKAVLPVTNDVALTMSANYDGTSSIYYVNVATDKVDGFNGIGFKMSYDKDALELVKDGITGLGSVSITREAEAGMVDINSYFMDKEFTGTITVAFKSKGMNKNFDFELVNASVSIDNVISAVSKLASISVDAIPTVYSLNQNFPNPFNPTTTIEYTIPQAGSVELVIYNMAGQKVRTLINENQPAAYKKVVWDGRNDMGETVGAGMYFYKLVSGNFNKIQKMTLIK